MIYLDNAATSYPKPSVVIASANEALTSYGGNPGRSGHAMSVTVGEKIYNCRETISDFFNAYGGENVIFTSNATHALNLALFGSLSGHVITTVFEHNSVLRPLEELRSQGKISYTAIAPSLTNDSLTVARIRASITPQTRAVVVTHASNVCGRILPVNAIGQLCKQRNLLFIVDASQSAGHIKINMRNMGADILCTAGHKGLLGPTGTGLLLKRPDIDLSPLMFGGTGTNSQSLFQPDEYPERLECGTLNVSGILGLTAGIELLKNQQTNFERQHIQYAVNRLRNINKVELYNQYNTSDYVGIISFNIKGLSSNQTANFLSENGVCVRGGLHCAPLAHRYFETSERGLVRASAGYFTSKSDIDGLIYAVSDICKMQN